MKVKLIVDGGSMKPGPAVAQQLGPMGINLGKVIEDVNKATTGFKGVKVPVELDVDPKTKSYKIEVFSPPMAELIKKELGLEKGSGAAGTLRVGNIAFESLIGIAKMKQSNLPVRTLRGAVKMAVGSCVSLSVLIDSKNPKDVTREIEEGKYDREIRDEITAPSEEKKKELGTYFAQVKAEQERKMKVAEEAKKAAEEAAAAAATAAETAGAAAPAAGEKAPAAAATTGKTAVEKKPAAGEKKAAVGKAPAKEAGKGKKK